LHYINDMPGPAKEYPARFELRLTEADRDAVTSIAKQDGMSVGALIRELIRLHIAKRRRAARKRQPPD
jgi:predicted HicB family RNase H-like nuclease